MAVTIRDQILDAMLTRMLTVDAGAKRGFLRLAENELQGLCLWDGAESGIKTKYGKQACMLQVNVEIADRLEVADEATKVGNELLGQVIKAMISTNTTLGGLAKSVVYENSLINYPQTGSGWIVGVNIIFSVEYETTLGNPYT